MIAKRYESIAEENRTRWLVSALRSLQRVQAETWSKKRDWEWALETLMDRDESAAREFQPEQEQETEENGNG